MPGDVKVGGRADKLMSPLEFSEKGASFDQCRPSFGDLVDPVVSVGLSSLPYSSENPVTWQ